MDRLIEKVVIVTGATSGIGIGIARLCAAEGAKVVVCGRRQDKGQAVVETILKEGGEAFYHFMDLVNPKSIEDLMADVAAKYGKIDVLINNASNVALPDGPLEQVSLEMWDDIFDSDLRGTFYACKTVIPYMRANGKGSIVNIGSCASVCGDLSSTAFSCAKAGVNLLTQNIALQYGKENIRCNCVRPGLIITPENDAYIPQPMKDVFVDNIEVNRYGCPEDIGHLCVFLASDESEYVTGQLMNVDGGANSHASTVSEFRKMGTNIW